MDLKVQINSSPAYFAKDIWITRRAGGGIEVLQSDMKTWFEIPERGYIDPNIEPTIRVAEDIFQLLVDEIIKGKFKPSEGKFSEGKLEAMGDHLKDLRQLLKLK